MLRPVQPAQIPSYKAPRAKNTVRPKFSLPIFHESPRIKSPNSGSRIARNLQKTNNGELLKSPKNQEMDARIFDAFLCTCNQPVRLGGFIDTPEGGCYIASLAFVGAH